MADESESQLLAEVLAIVSHDLRTPLSVVHTTASMLLNPKYQLTPQQVREQHERIRRNAELMNRMIGDVVDIMNLRAGKLSIDPHPLTLNDPLGEAVAAHQAAARDKGITLAYEPGSEMMQVAADRARLTQLFQNLIGNAIKNCNAGGSVTITSHARGTDAQIEISDTGPGIPAEDLPHIFDPHYRGAPGQQKSAARLGLYIGKGIVDAHAGQIRCASEPGAGTTFHIALPLAVQARLTPGPG